MPHSSSECSTAFEVSGSAALTASDSEELSVDQECDAYSDSFESDNDAKSDWDSAPVSRSIRKEFIPLDVGTRVQVFWPDDNAWLVDQECDAYSDSFESDNDAKSDWDSAPVSRSIRKEFIPLDVGTRVQVFWPDDNAWLDGAIQSVEEGLKPRYLVHYDDGEQQWEDPSSIRPLPASLRNTSQYDQLQQLLPLNKQTAVAMVGRRAIVFWADDAKWYDGTVSSAQSSPPALKIEYDDGDSCWEQKHSFHCILLHRPISLPASSNLMTSALPSPELVLYARPYKQVVSDHFQPVRIAQATAVLSRSIASRSLFHVHAGSSFKLKRTAAPHKQQSRHSSQTPHDLLLSI